MCGVLKLLWTVNRWALLQGGAACPVEKRLSRPPQSFSVLCPLSATTTVCLLLCAPLLFLIILLCERTAAAGPNLAWCFGLDELVAQWNKPVCLLHKPMFQAYTLWRLYTALLKKKEVISAAVWVRSWVERDHIGPAQSLLAWFLESL